MQSERLKYFHILTAIYVASMTTSLIVSARLMSFQVPFIHTSILLTGGTWSIPLTFLVQDITTEVYGYAKSRHLVQMTLIILSGVVLYLKMTTYLPIPTIHNIDPSYDTVFNAIPRHFFALLVAILCGNLFNDYLLSRLKKRLKGKYMALRLIGSTMIGEALLQFIGTSAAWLGSLQLSSQIIPFAIFSYCYKIIFSAILTPINVSVCKWLKTSEGIDAYDENTNYNPLSFRTE